MSAIDDLCELLDGAGMQIKFGLRQQGHMDTVRAMLDEGKSWEEIGKVIGWHGPTAQRFFAIESEAESA